MITFLIIGCFIMVFFGISWCLPEGFLLCVCFSKNTISPDLSSLFMETIIISLHQPWCSLQTWEWFRSSRLTPEISKTILLMNVKVFCFFHDLRCLIQIHSPSFRIALVIIMCNMIYMYPHSLLCIMYYNNRQQCKQAWLEL